jgi:hypothetical protein
MKSTCVFCDPARSRASWIVAMRDAALPRRREWLRRFARFFSWIGPGAVLVLVPKCPACLAAYIALGTGIGVSLPVAENLRVGAITLSIAALIYSSFVKTRGGPPRL